LCEWNIQAVEVKINGMLRKRHLKTGIKEGQGKAFKAKRILTNSKRQFTL